MEKKYLYVLLILTILIPSCRTVQTCTQALSDTKERSLEYGKDSVYIIDSILVVRSADTVFRERWRTKYVEHVVQKTDTVVQINEKLVEKQVVQKVIPRWAWWVTGYGVLVTGLIILGIILKIKRVM